MYSQRDPIWAADHLGYPTYLDAGSTIGRYGCAITVVGRYCEMIIGGTWTPKTIQATLAKSGGFKNGNLVDWPKLPSIFASLKFSGRSDYYFTESAKHITLAELAKVNARLDEAEPIIIYVDSSDKEPGLQQHFVLGLSRVESGAIVIGDPWDGEIKLLSPAYGQSDQEAIRGIIWLTRAHAPESYVAPRPLSMSVEVIADRLNVRSAPVVAGRNINGILTKGTRVAILSQKNGFGQIGDNQWIALQWTQSVDL